MSGFLPVGTTLQLSDISGNINHQGVLTSSVNGTPLIGATFPTTSTGTSTCHSHYTEAGTNALKFLNASASGVGGHQLFVSTSTDAPVKTFDVNKDRAVLDTRLLNSTGKTVLDMSGNELKLTSSDNRYQNKVQTSQILMTDGVSSTSTTTTASKYQVANGDLNTSTTLNPALIQIGDSTNLTTVSQTQLQIGVRETILSSTLTDASLTITDLSNNTSILSSTDLTFNSISLPTRVSTNATNITNLTIKQTNLIYQFASPAIYADGRPMLATPTSIINSYAINSWYFKNTTAGWKINWYIGPDNGMLVSDVLGLYLRFFNVSTISNDNIMFLTVYTKLQASGNYASWFHSSMTYIIDQSITPVVNTNYTMFENCSGSCPNPSHYATTLVGMQQSSVNNPRGTYAPTDEILAFSIGSNSASPVNTVEFVLQKFGIMTSSGTQEFQFAPLI